MASGSSGGTRRALRSWTRYSRITGRSLATTGVPAAWASKTVRPQPYFSEGKASTSAAR